MTTFAHPVERVTERELLVLHSKPKPVVVRLVDDKIEFRHLRGRSRWVLPVREAFLYAVRLAVIGRGEVRQ